MRLAMAANAFEFVYAVQTLEHAGQLVYVLHIKTNAVVLPEIEGLFLYDGSAHKNFRYFVGSAELDDVRE
jgi:hypothetical protein